MSDATFLQTFLRTAFEAARRLLFPAMFALAALPVQAESVDPGSLEARVDRLLWQLINDERYGHLQVAANYERLRARLLEETCLVSSAPCAPDDRLMHQGMAMSTEMTAEQEAVIEQLVFTLRNTSASAAQPAPGLMVSAAE